MLTMTPLELRVAMDALDLNQSSLARTLDVSRRLVAYWAAGARPVPSTAAMLLNLMLTTGSTVKDLRI
jgi:DNA-binding transcriptional regulator YiaG